MAKTILLADDSVTIQKVVALTFMDEDYDVQAVSDGSEAMRRFAALAPALVIADVHMPGLSGYEVCRQVKQSSPGTPVLLLVGTFEPFDEAKAVEVEADGHLKKPFDSQDLLSRVAALVGRQPAAPPAVAPPPPAPAPEAASPFDVLSSPFELEEAYPEPVAVASDPFPSFEHAADDVFELEPEVAAPDLATQQQVAYNFGGQSAEPIETALFEPVIEPAAPVAEEAVVWPHELAVEPEPAARAEPVSRSELPWLSIPASAPAPVAEPVAAEPVAAVPVAASNGRPELSDADIDRIARRVADLVAEKIVREVAWEVIPDLAEIAIRERIQELESETE